MLGTSLAVWDVAFLAPFFDGGAWRLTVHLGSAPVKVRAALGHAAAYPDEIQAAIVDNGSGPEPLRRTFPGLETVTVGEA